MWGRRGKKRKEKLEEKKGSGRKGGTEIIGIKAQRCHIPQSQAGRGHRWHLHTVTPVISLEDASDNKICEFPTQRHCAPSILMDFAARAKSQRRAFMEKSLFRALTHFGFFGKAFFRLVCF